MLITRQPFSSSQKAQLIVKIMIIPETEPVLNVDLENEFLMESLLLGDTKCKMPEDIGDLIL